MGVTFEICISSNLVTKAVESKEKFDIPTIVLSARGEEYDKLFGFSVGIDDYLTKPFSPKELIARIKAITKRNNNEVDRFVYEDLVVDFKSHYLMIDGKEILSQMIVANNVSSINIPIIGDDI